MMNSFIRKVGESTYKNLYDTYKIIVLESDGLNDLPERKGAFTEDWITSNGIKVIEPVSNVYKPISVKFKFALFGSESTMRSNFKAFWAEIVRVVPNPSTPSIGSSAIEYYDSYMGSGKAKKMRLTSGASDLEFVRDNVTDQRNPNTSTSVVTFNMEFSIDIPDINTY